MGIISDFFNGRRYRKVLDAAAYPFFIVDQTSRRFVMSNKAASDLYGYSAREFRRLTPMDLSASPAETGRALNNNGPHSVITNHKKKDGTLITVKIRSTVEGRYFITIIQDITDENRLRDDLIRSEIRLREAQKLGKLGWWEYSYKTGRYTGSSELSRIFFETDTPFNASYETFISLIHPDDRDQISKKIDEYSDSSTETYTLEYRIKTAKGPEKYLSVISNISRDLSGKPIGRFGCCQDVTESRGIMDQLVIARMRAEESEKLKVAFLANFSHELRTPLNAIVGFSNLLTSPQAHSIDKSEMIKQINLNSERLVRLVGDVYELSKIESDSLELHYSDVEINSFVRKLEKIANSEKESLSKDGIAINIDMPLSGKTITQFADPAKLKQVFSCLISNALKFTPEGSVTIGYKLNDTSEVTYYVKDTGIGIDPEIRQDIFNPFYQGESFSTKVYQGTGLGLSIAKNLVSIMNGKIWVDNNNGQGSAFYFTLGAPVTIGD